MWPQKISVIITYMAVQKFGVSKIFFKNILFRDALIISDSKVIYNVTNDLYYK